MDLSPILNAIKGAFHHCLVHKILRLKGKTVDLQTQFNNHRARFITPHTP
ncbi:hypothetical protein COLO4_35385 [Corchorus olitorius]|uniref:Uncharacterized protein n=1 Tax=Corchorus olitorius TaxID=93759 RepID=A0A1R3GHE8_9ROSI|nr:hypothetical protein COLO4_35385 [Corchorus olitorius]